MLASGVPTAVLRAAVIIGSGSASFEMLRYLTERLPAMVCPRWVRSRIQPIAIADVLRYLVGVADAAGRRQPRLRHRRPGRPDVRADDAALRQGRRAAPAADRAGPAAHARGCPRSGSTSSRRCRAGSPARWSRACPTPWSATSTTSPATSPTRADGLVGIDRAVELALANIRDSDVETRWSNAVWSDAPSDPLPTDPDWAGGSLYTDERTRVVDAGAEDLWQVIVGIGGDRGWYSFPLGWAVRGLLDRLVGGVGLRRGRRDPDRLYVGEALDFWRVEELCPGELLRLRAEMRVPGGPGWSCGSRPTTTAGPSITSARSSTRAGCPGISTGGRSGPSTAWSSAPWRATSPAPPSSAERPASRRTRARRSHERPRRRTPVTPVSRRLPPGEPACTVTLSNMCSNGSGAEG